MTQKELDQAAAIKKGKELFGEDRWNYSGEFTDFKAIYTTAFAEGIAHARSEEKEEFEDAVKVIYELMEHIRICHPKSKAIASVIAGEVIERYESKESK